MLALAAGAGLVWACGGDDASVQDGGPDATASDAPSPDASADAADAADAVADASVGCDTTAPFGAPVLVTELTSAATDVGARLSPDGLTVYFASNRDLGDAAPPGFRTLGTSFDIYRATRSAVDQPFGTPVRADDLDTDAGDGYASLSSTGLTVYFASERDAGVVRLFSATRGATSDPFGAASEITGVAPGAFSDDEPYVTADDSELYFSSARAIDAGGGGYHVFRSPIDAGVIGPPALLPVRTDDAGSVIVAFSPVVSADRLTIYFASPGGGAMDVWRATRASTSDPFSNPAPVSELNTASYFDAPSYLTPDGCTIYLHSNRKGGAGQFHIYRASKPSK